MKTETPRIHMTSPKPFPSLALCVALLAVPAISLAGQARPNVLFIAIDDLNDWVGYLGGHPQASTPNIDALAATGTAFLHAYCPAPVCGPSRTALMYGMSPHKSGSYGHHEIYSPGKRIPEKQLPLNLVFQNNGYYTAGCGKIFHYPDGKRGWDDYASQFPDLKPRKIQKVGAMDYGIQETGDDSDTAEGKLTDWAIRQLQAQPEPSASPEQPVKPFFIALGLRKPHLPWVAPRKYFERIAPESVVIPEVPEDDLGDVPAAGKTFAHNMVGFHRKDDHKAILGDSPDGWQRLVHAYLATCSFADANVGRIIDALNDSPHRDNTIIVLWGDHGWHLGEKEHWRKMALWERSTRTPLIIKMPGSTPQKPDAPVSLQDIFPTLVDLCGLKVDQPLDGNSLKPLITENGDGWEKPVIMSHGPGNFAIRLNQWRLIRYADGSEELYDIKADPHEFANLANKPEHQDTLKSLRTHVPKTWAYVLDPRFKVFADSFAAPPGKPPTD